MKPTSLFSSFGLNRLLSVILTVAALLLPVRPARGTASLTWIGSTDGYWSHANWTQSGTPPVVFLNFAANGQRRVNTNDLANASYFELWFFTNSYVLRGNTLTLYRVLASYPSGFSTIEMPLFFYNSGATPSIEVPNAGSSLFLGGPVTVDNENLQITANGNLFATGPWSILGGNPITFGGTGTVTLNASSSLGRTNFVACRLDVGGAIPDALFEVTGTLGGNGSVGRVDLKGGILSPGFSCCSGALTVKSNLTASAASIMRFGIYGTDPGQFSQVLFTGGGSFALNGCNAVILNGQYPAGASHTLIDMPGTKKVTGTFANWPEGARRQMTNGLYEITYQGGPGSNDVIVTLIEGQSIWTGMAAGLQTIGNWSAAAEWLNNVVPATDSTIVFPFGAARPISSNTLAGRAFNRLLFTGSNYVLRGLPVPLKNGIISSNAASRNTLEAGAVLLASQSFSNVFSDTTLVATNIVPGNHNLRLDGPGTFQINSIGAGTGAVMRLGGGHVTLFGTNAHTGPVHLLDGSMTIGINADLTRSSGIVVSNGPLIYAGRSSSITLVHTNADLRIGGGFGVYDLAGNLDLRAGKIQFSIAGPISSQRLKVTGTVSLTTNATLQINGAYAPVVGDSFLLVDNDGTDAVSGECKGLPEGGEFLIAGGRCRISYRGGDGNDITITGVSVSRIWDGSEPLKTWTTAANWVSNTPPAAGEGLIFPVGVTALTTTNNFPAFTRFDSLRVSNSYVFHGAAMELTGGFLISTTAVFHPSLRLAQNQVWHLRGPFAVNGPLELGTNQVNFFGGGSAAFAGGISGTGGFNSLHALTNLTFNGTNTFTGDTRLRGGVIQINQQHFNGALRLEQTQWTLPPSALVSNSIVAISNGLADTVTIAGRLLGGSLAITGGVFNVSANAVISNAPTTLAAGTLTVQGTMPASPLMLIGGTLTGTGTVASVTATGGALQPGLGTGRLRTGSLLLAPGVAVNLDLAGNAPGVTHDQIQVTGTVNLTGATLNLAYTEATLNFGDQVVLLDNDGADAVAGTFTGLPEAATFALGLINVRLSYVGGTGNDVVLTVIGAIPRGTWTGLAGTNAWNNATNWVRNTLPQNGDSLIFPADAQTRSNFNNLGLASAAAVIFGGSNYFINANNPTLSIGVLATNAAGTNTLNTIHLGANSIVSNTPGTLLVLSGETETETVTLLPQGALEFHGPLSGTNTVTMDGPGTLRLLTNSTDFGGALLLQRGLTEVFTPNALGSRFGQPAATTVAPGASLALKTSGSFSEFLLLGGTLRAAAPGINWFGSNLLTHASSRLTVDAGASLHQFGPVASTTGLRKEGPGLLSFVGAKNYTGGTFVGGGTLLVDGLASASPAPPVVVSNGATLTGVGALGPVTVNLGVLAPGGVVTNGVLSPSDGLSLSGQATLRSRLSGLLAVDYSRMVVTGPVVIAASRLELAVDFSPPIGATFDLILNDGNDPVIGAFLGLPQNGFATNGSAVFRIVYNGGTGNDVVVTTDRYLTTGLTRSWTGAGTNALWSTPQNWAGNVAPKPGDALLFPTGALQRTNQNDFVTNTYFHSITLGGSGYVLGSNNVAVLGGIVATNLNGTNTLALPVAILTNLNFRCEEPGATLVFTAPVDSNARTLGFAGRGAILGLAPITGPGGVDATGPGLAELRGANTYAGSTRVGGGRLRLENSPPGASGGGVIVTNNATLELSGPTEVADDFTVSGKVVFTNGVNFTVNGPFRFPAGGNGAFHVPTGALARLNVPSTSGGGGLTKEGPGRLLFNVSSIQMLPHTGLTVANAGTLIFQTPTLGVAASFSNLVANAGATLMVTGKVAGIRCNAGGILAPGTLSGFGPLMLQGGLTLASGATLDIDVNGVEPFADFDAFGVTGPVNLGSAVLRVHLGYAAVLGSQYPIIDNDGADPVLGTFSGLPEGAVLVTTNGAFRLSYVGGDGNDVTLTFVSSPPSITGLVPLSGGAIQILARGQPGSFALIEATEDFTAPIAWTLLGATTVDGLGLIDFTDTDAVNHPIRFYRVGTP